MVDKEVEATVLRVCRVCKQDKPLSSYSDLPFVDGKSTICPSCAADIVDGLPDWSVTPEDRCREIASDTCYPTDDTCSSVYILMDAPYYKVGVSRHVEKRIESLQIGNPRELVLVGVIPSSQAYTLEASIHELFREKRVRGEWFELSEEDVSFITGLGEGWEKDEQASTNGVVDE